jgi:hypothetical protein
MAGDWIKMRMDLATSPKVVRMSSALRTDRLHIIGGLHAVWCLFDVHSADGHLDGYTLQALDDLIGFPGFGAAMVAVGWLSDDGDSLCTPRFDEHNGQSAKRRATETERKRESRKVSAPDADKKRTREEKRREDKDTVAKATDGQAVKSQDDLTKAELWSAGKSLLEASGLPAKQCGSFVGKLVKDHGDAIVIEAVRAAVLAQPADPVEYLKAACQRLTGQRQPMNKQIALEQRNRAVAEEWLASQGDIHAVQ